MPELVPIKAKVHSQQISNGFSSNGFDSNNGFLKNSKQSSLFNFEKKNRVRMKMKKWSAKEVNLMENIF